MIQMVCLKTHLGTSGHLISEGGWYELPEALARQHVALGLGAYRNTTELVDGAAPGAGVEISLGSDLKPVVDPPPPTPPAGPEPVAEWKLTFPPEVYLEKWPDGPNAPHARAVIAAREAAGIPPTPPAGPEPVATPPANSPQ